MAWASKKRDAPRHYFAKLASWLAQASYARKWLFLASLIGVVAGLGAVVFYTALTLSTHFFLGELAGYHVPGPVGEGGGQSSLGFVRPWAIPLVAALGALVGGILVFGIAPDAEGHGTDAAIAAVHNNPRSIRLRTVAVKIVASALTIGSGGSGGREGPTGQISAGFGSYLARLFDLAPADARIAVASGIGSGIGAIFGAPLGGAVLATEILYRDDFEVEALLPSFIASAISYIVFGSVEGFEPLFGYAHVYELSNPSQLIWFAVIGILGGLLGLLYAKGFYGGVELFGRLPIPRWARPSLGGALVGLMALAIPQVLGTGYGWIQQGLSSKLLSIPLWIVIVLPFARIVATTLSIGSGGSGGIFGPGMVIGAFLGAAVWRGLEPLVPSMGHNPAPYVIVGMMSCFGGISRAPLAVMLMVAEMTGSLSIVVPAMVAVGLATLIVRRGDDSIYRSQLGTRAEAPAHRVLVGLPLLATISVGQAKANPVCILEASTSVISAVAQMESAGVPGAPVVNTLEEGRFVGVVSLEATKRISHATSAKGLLDCVDPGVSPVQEQHTLAMAFEALTNNPMHWAPVVDMGRRVVGVLSVSDVLRGYASALAEGARKIARSNAGNGMLDLSVMPGSYLEGLPLRDSPPGVLVVTIEREGETIIPEGDARFDSGDRLIVLGEEAGLMQMREWAESTQCELDPKED